ncbi:hypothetical protein [Nocardiopsis protaetiae]|uniref:hypothetical protein n=1 Tax=Nocardiopsis protaetiae TaxID=3382270 RepID=UPI00387AA5D1
MDEPSRPEIHRHGPHTLRVTGYYGNATGGLTGAAVEIDGHRAQLILNRHGELDTRPLGQAPDIRGDLLRLWQDQGLTEHVCRGITANADDTDVWQGPTPERLRPLVRHRR